MPLSTTSHQVIKNYVHDLLCLNSNLAYDLPQLLLIGVFLFSFLSRAFKDKVIRLIFITIFYICSSLIPFFVEIDINIVPG